MDEDIMIGATEIRDLLSGEARVCEPHLRLAVAASTLHEQGIGALGVVDNGRLIGIFTERDLVRAVAEGADLKGDPVSSYMTPDPDDLAPDVEPIDAARWMLARGYRHLPVVEDGVLLGMVSIKDLMWAIMGD
jgi:CBS domain-containing protein